jgi:hypothetical protein
MFNRSLVGAGTRILLFCIIAAVIAGPSVYAQTTGASGDEWKFRLAPYLMIPWMDGKAGLRGHEFDVNISAGDIFSKLQMGAMGNFEARKGAWGVGVDAMYMALGTDIDRPQANVDFDQAGFGFTGLRALNQKVDLTFGARWNVIRGNIEFKGPLATGTEVGQTKQWVDPIVGLNIHQPLGGRWHFGLVTDIGGFGAGSDFAWEVFPTVGVDVGKRARLGIGYRAIGMDYKTGSDNTLFRYDVITSGLVLGMAFNF